MEIATKEIRGLNLNIIIAWVGGVLTFVVVGTLWYAGITDSVNENAKAMIQVQETLKEANETSLMQRREINNKIDAQQLQIDKLAWEWENFKDFNDISINKKNKK